MRGDAFRPAVNAVSKFRGPLYINAGFMALRNVPATWFDGGNGGEANERNDRSACRDSTPKDGEL
jgi:hypothetical protein